MSETAVIVLVGGGPWIAALCDQLSMARIHRRVELRLVARNPVKLRTITAHIALRVARQRPDWKVECSDMPRALEGANLTVLMLRVGGSAARAMDEDFPRRFGLIGDEGLGLGGYANALRTLPVMESIAAAVVRHAPDSPVLNLVAPLGLTTRVLLDAGCHAVGVCELPVVTERCVVDVLGLPAGAFDYAGLNHLGWFWPRAGSFSPEAVAALGKAGLAAPETLAEFGAIPLKYFYRVFDVAVGGRLGVNAPRNRAAHLAREVDHIISSMSSSPGDDIAALKDRAMPWFSEALVPLIRSILTGGNWHGFLNIRNFRRLPELRAETVVELRGRYGGAEADVDRPETHPPNAVRSFLKNASEAESLIYDFHLQRGNLSSLVAAIRLLPPGRFHVQSDMLAEAVRAAGKLESQLAE